MNDLQKLTTLAAASGAVITLLAFPAKACAAVVSTAKFITGVIRAPAIWFREQSQAARDIQRVVKEVTPNGGGSMKDVVQAIRAEQFIATQRHRANLNDAPEGWFESGADGNSLWVNRTFCRMVGRQLEEILDRRWEGIIHPDEREAVVEDWDRSTRLGYEFSRDVTYIKSDGSTIRCHAQSHVIRDVYGRPVGHYGWVKPIGPQGMLKRNLASTDLGAA